jgi:alpha-beta hydrolase superfamily lysophospholipase
MMDFTHIDYASLDRPEISFNLFHPRPQYRPKTANDSLIPVADDIQVGACFHMIDPSAPSILFFHGNGEIVSDYDEMGAVYNQMDLNFIAVDYRGYGRSDGEPSASAMMRDSHAIFQFVRAWLEENDYRGRLMMMGRSLGSAPALELAAVYQDPIDALIIESGFAFTGPLLALVGVDLNAIDFEEAQGFLNLEKIKVFSKPTLIIHAEKDHIIPISDGRALFDACPSPQKDLLEIPDANHNDILLRGFEEYTAAISDLAGNICSG